MRLSSIIVMISTLLLSGCCGWRGWDHGYHHGGGEHEYHHHHDWRYR